MTMKFEVLLRRCADVMIRRNRWEPHSTAAVWLSVALE